MRKTIGFLTIGQSPREDVLRDMRPLLGSTVEIIEAGALDSLSLKEIEMLKPGQDDFSLITRLQDGRSVVIGRKKILSLLQNRAKDLEAEGVDILALLCTEEFSELVSSKLLLQPGRILRHLVFSVMVKGSLFVLVPLPEQKEASEEKWRKEGLGVSVAALSPYEKKVGQAAVFRQIQAASPDFIVLDCIGYPLELKRRIQQETGKPVLLPREILAAAMGFFL